MAAASRYRKFLRLCQKWPLDDTKHGRDLAAHIRERVAMAFKHGDNTQIADEKECDRIYDNLQKINTDYFKNKYPRLYDSTATERTLEECRLMVATDSIQELEDLSQGTFSKMKSAVFSNDDKS
ncbi:ubiquinol-cytochrome c reductase complex assembly factor 2-like [Ptychodera flava]|uniref:ubiquinol-cytochrome c reductase complex assembly factor 2-like n=1 Tax=Ptychodera flava TaxID=63121 RepID=UPI00396A728F